MTKLYIKIIDPIGATQGYGGPPVPVECRILSENGTFHGWECLRNKFNTQQDISMFLSATLKQPQGSFGRLTWEHDGNHYVN